MGALRDIENSHRAAGGFDPGSLRRQPDVPLGQPLGGLLLSHADAVVDDVEVTHPVDHRESQRRPGGTGMADHVGKQFARDREHDRVGGVRAGYVDIGRDVDPGPRRVGISELGQRAGQSRSGQHSRVQFEGGLAHLIGGFAQAGHRPLQGLVRALLECRADVLTCHQYRLQRPIVDELRYRPPLLVGRGHDVDE